MFSKKSVIPPLYFLIFLFGIIVGSRQPEEQKKETNSENDENSISKI